MLSLRRTIYPGIQSFRRSSQLFFSRGNITSPDHIVRSPAQLQRPSSGNFVQFCLEGIEEKQDKVALVCSDTGRTMTFGQYRDNIARWGGLLRKQGVRPGEVVAVLSPNTIDTNCVVYGTIAAGCVFTGISPLHTPAEIAHSIKDSGARILVVFGPLEPLAQKALEIAQLNLPLFSIGPSSSGTLPRVEEIFFNPSVDFADPLQMTGKESMAVLYSSGTTGAPKAIDISHNAAIAAVEICLHPMFCISNLARDQSQMKVTQLFPLFHMAGLIAVGGSALRQGLQLVNIMKFDPASFLDKVFKYKVNGLHLLPSLMNFALSQEKFCPANCSHIDAVLSGAAPVPQSSADKVLERLGPQASFFHGYGMTEMLTVAQDPLHETRFGYTGQLLPSQEAKIVDIKTGQTLPPHLDGEICLRGPTMMSGYRNSAGKTSDVIDADGWYHSGDVGHFDKDGYLKVVDRTKELIKVNALQVSPSEVENVILGIPEVVEVGVVGVPHEKTGEAPRAYVRVSAPIDEKKIHDHVAKYCARYKHLTGGIRFVDDFPRNATGKILKKELLKLN